MEGHMNNLLGIGRLCTLQLNMFRTPMIKQAHSIADQDWHNVNGEFVKQPGLKSLPSNIRAVQCHSFIACSRLSLPDGALDTICDKSPVEFSYILRRLMRDDKYRHMERMLA